MSRTAQFSPHPRPPQRPSKARNYWRSPGNEALVMKGSPVRIRASALESSCKSAISASGSLAVRDGVPQTCPAIALVRSRRSERRKRSRAGCGLRALQVLPRPRRVAVRKHLPGRARACPEAEDADAPRRAGEPVRPRRPLAAHVGNANLLSLFRRDTACNAVSGNRVEILCPRALSRRQGSPPPAAPR